MHLRFIVKSLSKIKMPEQLDSPTRPVPEDPHSVGWEDLAAQVGSGSIPSAFEPLLVEQLTARGVPIPAFESTTEADLLQSRNTAESDTSQEITPAHHQQHLDLAEPVVPNIGDLPPEVQDAIGERVELGQMAENEVIDFADAPKLTTDTVPESSGLELDPKRAEQMAYAENNEFKKLADAQRQINNIKKRFPDTMPSAAAKAVEDLQSRVLKYQEGRDVAANAAAQRYDARKERLEAYHVEPKHFVDVWAGQKLQHFQVSVEAKQADRAVNELLNRASEAGGGQSVESWQMVVRDAIELKRASQQYIMENAEHSLEGWELPPVVHDEQVIRAIIPNLPREATRQLYDQQTELTTLIDTVVSDQLLQQSSLWPHDTVCMAVDAMGYDTAQDLLESTQGNLDSPKNQQAKRLTELLGLQEGSHAELDLRLEYYRKRVENNHSLDQDLTIAADMVVAMGIERELAADIVRSAEGKTEGFKVIGLDPSLAIVSIAQKVERLGVDNVKKLHDEMGYTSFHRYDVGHLEHMLRVVNQDPAALESLRGGNTLVMLIDATDDAPGAFIGLAEMTNTQSTEGESLIFEVGSMGGRHTANSIMQKYASFLTERGINIETLFIAGHGYDNSGGIIMGGLDIGLEPTGEQIESEGMRALFNLMNDEGTIIVNSCSQGAINPNTGVSTVGEVARVANLNNNKDIWVYGVNVPTGGFMAAAGGNGVQASEEHVTVAASVDEEGRLQEQVLPDSYENPYVIPVPAIKTKRAA